MKTTMPALAAEYRALAEADPAALRRDFDAIVAYMKGSTAIHHGEYVRTCFSPKLLPAADFDRLAADMQILYRIFEKVIDAYFADAGYRALFGFDTRTEDLILHARRSPSLVPMARIDFFYNEATGSYTFCEFNTDGASAMNEDRELHNAQRLSAAYRAFTARHRTRTCELFDSWVATVCRLWQKAGGAGAPCVAIVDYLECGTVNEFEIFRRRFEAAGLDAVVCDVRELRYDGHTLCAPDGRRIDVVYRRAVTSDLLAHYAQSEALRLAARQDPRSRTFPEALARPDPRSQTLPEAPARPDPRSGPLPAVPALLHPRRPALRLWEPRRPPSLIPHPAPLPRFPSPPGKQPPSRSPQSRSPDI